MKAFFRFAVFILSAIAAVLCLLAGEDTVAIILVSYILWLDIIDRLEGL